MQCSLSVSLYRKSISASILCVVLFVPGTVTLLYDVMRTSFDFHIGFCYVLSHDAKAEKLQAKAEAKKHKADMKKQKQKIKQANAELKKAKAEAKLEKKMQKKMQKEKK